MLAAPGQSSRSSKTQRGASKSELLGNLRLIGICFAAFGGLLLFAVSLLEFFKSTVINVSEDSFFKRKDPPGFITQDLSSVRLRRFQSQIPREDYPPNLASAIKIRHWVRLQQPAGDSWKPHPVELRQRFYGDLEDPLLILAAQRHGAPAVCRRFSYLMVGAIESIGMQARVLLTCHDFWKSNTDGHIMTEVWIPELDQWVLMDAMWDVMYVVNGKPASALDVYNAARMHKATLVRVIRIDGSATPVNPNTLERMFKHIYVAMTNAFFDGYRVCFSCDRAIAFAHLSNDYSPDYPDVQKGVAFVLGYMTLLLGFGIFLASGYLTRFGLADYSISPIVTCSHNCSRECVGVIE